MRSNLKRLKKQLDDKDRASKAAVSADVVEEVKALLAANPKAPVIVGELKAYSNTKVSLLTFCIHQSRICDTA
jgi:D-ribose pyranose/furanose isomerase RbsD